MNTPTPAAFFDLDETLIRVNSAKLWVKHLWGKGELGVFDIVRSAGWLIGYRLALLDMTDVSKRAIMDLAGSSENAMREEVAQWYHDCVRPQFFQEALQRIEHHRAQGHTLVLLTASSPYLALPVAKELNFDHTLCSLLEVDAQGLFTGLPIEPLCYAEGKVHWAEKLAAEYHIDLDASYFYTDSLTDLSMLRRVGHPIATNPDPRLRRLALREGMEVLDFRT